MPEKKVEVSDREEKTSYCTEDQNRKWRSVQVRGARTELGTVHTADHWTSTLAK